MRKIIFLSLALYFIPWKSFAAPVLWIDNGHYYEVVQTEPFGLTWFQARDNAAALSYLGMPGHLVTITSAHENDFVNTIFYREEPSQFAWIGGWEPNDDGVWLWAVGPEAGIPLSYTNWGGIEPNDFNPQEDYLMFNIGNHFVDIAPGQWADAHVTPSANDPIHYYLVEYEAVESNAIPEPSTILLLSGGLVGVVLRRKRI